MRIVNTFPYFNESELLELRLRLLWDVVDHFIIVEANRTHTGLPRESTLEKDLIALGLNDPAKVTIISVDLSKFDGEKDNWVRENYQRDCAAMYFRYGDVVFVTDCDEIVDPNFVKYYAGVSRANPDVVVRIPMVFLNCRGDLCVHDENDNPRKWSAAYVLVAESNTTNQGFTLSKIRESFTRGQPKLPFQSIFLTDNGQVLDAGWHFSWMGDNGRRLTKWKSYAENGGIIPGADPDTADHINGHVPTINSSDPLGRDNHRLKFYHWNKLPEITRTNSRIRDFLFPGTKVNHFYFEPQFGENWFTFPNLYRGLVEWAPQEGARFVEVGVWKGRSAAFMATEIANSGKKIEFYAVDHWLGSSEHQDNPELKDLYDIYQKNIEPVRAYVKDMKMPSLEAAKQFEDGSLDFVFLDGPHEPELVEKDIKAWLPKVRVGGVLAGHDYYRNNPEFGGVKKAVDKVIGAHKIFTQENCWIYMVKDQDENTLQYKLESYIMDPSDPERNFVVGQHYESIGQLASAISFYIRTAERTENKLFQYESMIRAALCFIKQGTRGLSVRGLLHRAMTILPKRPEAYFLLARWWEREAQIESWVNCYSYASMGEQLCDKVNPPLRTNVEYPGWYGLLFEKAVSAWWVGQCEESRDVFLKLYKDSNVDASHRQAVINNLKFMESKTGKKLL